MKILAIAFVIVLIFGMFLAFRQQESKNPSDPTVTIHGHTFTVEVAATAEQKQKGLSFRPTLAKNHGMLFVFEEPHLETFWMYGMEFPIDIIFIRDDKIVTLYENVPIPKTDVLPNQLPKYPSKELVNYVLEINGGPAKEYGFKEGDNVKIEGIGK